MILAPCVRHIAHVTFNVNVGTYSLVKNSSNLAFGQQYIRLKIKTMQAEVSI